MILLSKKGLLSTMDWSINNRRSHAFKVDQFQDLIAGKKIGVVFSGGGTRGPAHVGVLRVLEKSGIRPDMVAGTSIGALAGLCVASGLGISEMIELQESLMPRGRLAKLPGGRLLHLRRLVEGGGMRHAIEKFLPSDPNIEDLAIPFRPTCVDLNSGKREVLSEGNAIDAVIASMTLPILGSPRRYGEKLLVDGGLVDNLPADILRSAGMEFVIGVDLGTNPEPWRLSGLLKWLPKTLKTMFRVTYVQQFNHLHRRRVSDVVIRPELDDVGFTEFACPVMLLARGDKAARAALPTIALRLHELQQANSRRLNWGLPVT